MKFDLYQIDAFTENMFGGNPACVVPLQTWLPDSLLLKIADENAVAETAFFVPRDGGFHLRWFTPEFEMDLCGHATLATAHVLKTILHYEPDQIKFETASGDLRVEVSRDLYTLDFPSRKPVRASLPDVIGKALNFSPKEVLKSRDYVLVYEKEQQVREMQIDRQLFDQINLDPGGVIVTAPGETCDFVSRFFTPQASILEDPVTGSAHCSLIPLWSERLNKKQLLAQQLSKRGGTLFCRDVGSRVLIGGKAKTYSVGFLETE